MSSWPRPVAPARADMRAIRCMRGCPAAAGLKWRRFCRLVRDERQRQHRPADAPWPAPSAARTPRAWPRLAGAAPVARRPGADVPSLLLGDTAARLPRHRPARSSARRFDAVAKNASAAPTSRAFSPPRSTAGGRGAWSAVPMPPQPQLERGQLPAAIAQWVGNGSAVKPAGAVHEPGSRHDTRTRTAPPLPGKAAPAQPYRAERTIRCT